MRDGAEAAKIQIPAVIFFFQLMLGDAPLEDLDALLALPTPDDFPVSERRDQIAAQRILTGARDARSAHRVGLLEVEGLDLRGHVMNEDGLSAELLAERRFVWSPEVLAPRERHAFFLEDL